MRWKQNGFDTLNFRFRIFASTIFFLMQMACSKITDTRESIAKEHLGNKINQESGGTLELESFKKVNGIERDFFGTKIYELEWEAVVLVKQEIWKSGDAIEGHWKDFHVLNQKPGGWDLIGSQAIHCNTGTTVVLSGNCLFENAEQGWRVSALNVIKSKKSNQPEFENSLSYPRQAIESASDQKSIRMWNGLWKRGGKSDGPVYGPDYIEIRGDSFQGIRIDALDHHAKRDINYMGFERIRYTEESFELVYFDWGDSRHEHNVILKLPGEYSLLMFVDNNIQPYAKIQF